MDSNKSLDKYKLIAHFLNDVHTSHGEVFNSRSLRLTLNKVSRRIHAEGFRYLTVALPRLGKAFDKALAGDTPLNAVDLWLKPQKDSKLPIFMGEFFNRVLGPDGALLQNPCSNSVKVIRQLCYLFYKYELPYTDEQQRQVVEQFERTEDEIASFVRSGGIPAAAPYDTGTGASKRLSKDTKTKEDVVRKARIRLARLFSSFDPTDITPRHGPGAVATKQRLWEKYLWTNVARKITDVYPLDAYFYASLGHVCDRLDSLQAINEESLPAKVCLVPKDSRGPRLISCEPVDFQWVQQGLGRAIVQLVERKNLTRFNVFFTNQQPNQIGALLGSSTGRYATLDLKEASDRVTCELVHLLFPEHISVFLDACRSASTELPNGKVLNLHKYAPMGSALCFPIMALTIWSILTASAPDAYTRKRILVYGDDVIVPTAFAENAIEQLESFGLKVNRDKSCTKGLFRESCGTDAFQGVNVTPVRLRTVWSSEPRPDVYSSWIAYANNFWDRGYNSTYAYIVGLLYAVYGTVPDQGLNLSCPSLREVPLTMGRPKCRISRRYQKRAYRVRTVMSPRLNKTMDGWSMLLRYFTEGRRTTTQDLREAWQKESDQDPLAPFSVRSYTRPHTSKLVWKWLLEK